VHTFIVDSSVIVKWLSQQNEDHLKQADAILQDVKQGKVEIITSELAKYEIGNALLIGKKLSVSKMQEALIHFYSLPIRFIKDTFEQSLITSQIMDKTVITYYDASFVSLTKMLNATLVTSNPKHQAKAKGVKVMALKDYKSS